MINRFPSPSGNPHGESLLFTTQPMNKAAQAAERPVMPDPVTPPTSSEQPGDTATPTPPGAPQDPKTKPKQPFVHINSCTVLPTKKKAISVSWTVSGGTVSKIIIEILLNDTLDHSVELKASARNYHFIPTNPGLYSFRVIPMIDETQQGKDDKSNPILIKNQPPYYQKVLKWSGVGIILILLLVWAYGKYTSAVGMKEDTKIRSEIASDLAKADQGKALLDGGDISIKGIIPIDPDYDSKLARDRHESLREPQIIIGKSQMLTIEPVDAPIADHVITIEESFVMIHPGKTVDIHVSRQKILRHSHFDSLLVWWDGVAAPMIDRNDDRTIEINKRPEVVTIKNNGPTVLTLRLRWDPIRKP